MKRQILYPVVLGMMVCGCGDTNGTGSNSSTSGPNSSVANASTGTNAAANIGTGSNSTSGVPQIALPFAACAGADAPDALVAAACFGDAAAPEIGKPLVIIEHAFVDYEGIPAVYLRFTFDPDFVDNTYGDTAVGWEKDRPFDKLVGSDHAQFVALDATGEVVFELKLDYIGDDTDADCGFSSRGVGEKDGEVLAGEEGDVLGWTTSLARNLNERGYCDFLENSPATDAQCTRNPDAPNWDYRVVYEVWLRRSSFEPNGFGTAHMTFVHASPAKGGENTVEIIRQECPCPDASTAECREDPNPQPDPNNDPGGAPGDACTTDADCATASFCYSGTCLPVIL